MEIYDYPDYRLFLKAAMIRLKEQAPVYSYNKIAQSVGCSPSFLKKLLARQTHLGLKHSSRLFKILRLSDFEKQYLYFWLLTHLLDDEEIRSRLKYILSVLKKRGQSGLKYLDNETEERAISVECETQDMWTHTALELSRVYQRPVTAADLQKSLLPGLVPSQNELDNAAKTALEILQKVQPNVESPIHDSKSGPISSVALDAMSSMKSIAQLSANLVQDLHNHGPFTVFTGLYAVDAESGTKILEILREARKKVMDINEQQEKPTRLMAVQIQGYFLTRKDN